MNFGEKLAEIVEMLAEMGGLVEDAIVKSIRTLVDKDPRLAEEVINELEPKINELERRIDEESLIALARYQPVANDLRRLVCIIKIDKDLERMGDHAENISRRATKMIQEPLLKPLIDIPRMAELAQDMTKKALDSFFQEDVELARHVIDSDAVVDELQEQIVRELISYVLGDAKVVNKALDLMFTGKDLERIADLATNIAENTFFLVRGEDVRHQGPQNT